MIEPLPCVCGSTDVQAKLEPDGFIGWFMKCMDCELETNSFWLKSEAIAAWNQLVPDHDEQKSSGEQVS